jgi:hypothetical protein
MACVLTALLYGSIPKEQSYLSVSFVYLSDCLSPSSVTDINNAEINLAIFCEISVQASSYLRHFSLHIISFKLIRSTYMDAVRTSDVGTVMALIHYTALKAWEIFKKYAAIRRQDIRNDR